MTRLFMTFLVCTLAACGNSGSKKQNQLAKDVGVFLLSGKYDVEIREAPENHKFIQIRKKELTITNTLGLIEFKGHDQFTALDSLSIDLNDSVLLCKFLNARFIDTVVVSADKNGLGEDYFGYEFGFDNFGGIANIKEFKSLLRKEDISGQQYLFIVGRTKKTNRIIIRKIERIVESGQKLVDTDKTFILTSNYFSQQ